MSVKDKKTVGGFAIFLIILALLVWYFRTEPASNPVEVPVPAAAEEIEEVESNETGDVQ